MIPALENEKEASAFYDDLAMSVGSGNLHVSTFLRWSGSVDSQIVCSFGFELFKVYLVPICLLLVP